MFRKIENKLLSWKKNPKRKPLIVVGARQVGKTYSIREFARVCYSNFVEINFQENIKAKNYFKEARDAESIKTYLEINNISKVFNEETLVFFDEVQICPEIINSLKFLPEIMNCDFICSGSMLGIYLNTMSSWPVGYTETINLYPMDFEEFCIAVGITEKYLNIVKNCLSDVTEIPQAIHEKMNTLFADYMICGGLPESVSEYVNNGILSAVRTNRRLLYDYRMDIAHYAEVNTRVKVQECFDSIPLQLSKENKKFQYSAIRHGYNARFFESSLNWLENSGLVIKTFRLSKIDLPLESYKELGIFKIYSFDSGILICQFSDSEISDFQQDALTTYKGMLYEQIVAQLLYSVGIKTYYYEPNTSSEIDFVINTSNGITPIEVKGGLHTKSTSFNNFIANHNVKKAYRLSKKNVGQSNDGTVLYLPIYSISFLF